MYCDDKFPDRKLLKNHIKNHHKLIWKKIISNILRLISFIITVLVILHMMDIISLNEEFRKIILFNHKMVEA